MSNVKISALPVLSCVDVCNSVLPIVQCGVTYQTAACNVGGGGGGGSFIPDPYNATAIIAGSRDNCAQGDYSFANGCCNKVCANAATVQMGSNDCWFLCAYNYGINAYAYYCSVNYTSCLDYSYSVNFVDATNCTTYTSLPIDYFNWDGNGTLVRFQISGAAQYDIGTLSVNSGTNSANASINGGFCNNVMGVNSTVISGNGNCAIANTTVSGFGNVAADLNVCVSGKFNLISCAAAYDGSDTLSGIYPDFNNGCTSLGSFYGDLSGVFPVGSTLSQWYLYGQPAGSVMAFNKEVCYSCFTGSATILCVTDPTYTFSGYMVKTGPYTSSSYNYHGVSISGGEFNRITGSSYIATISGGYNNVITSSGYSNISCAIYSSISGYAYQANILMGYCTNICGSDNSTILNGYCVGIGDNSNGSIIGAGNQACIGSSSGCSVVLTTNYAYGCVIGNSSPGSFVGVSIYSKIGNNSGSSAIVSGNNNNICDSSTYNFIGAGQGNTISGGYGSSIIGGFGNTISGYNLVHILGNNISANRGCTTFVTNLSIMCVPTSAAGLPSGAVWSCSGVLKIV